MLSTNILAKKFSLTNFWFEVTTTLRNEFSDQILTIFVKYLGFQAYYIHPKDQKRQTEYWPGVRGFYT